MCPQAGICVCVLYIFSHYISRAGSVGMNCCFGVFQVAIPLFIQQFGLLHTFSCFPSLFSFSFFPSLSLFFLTSQIQRSQFTNGGQSIIVPISNIVGVAPERIIGIARKLHNTTRPKKRTQNRLCVSLRIYIHRAGVVRPRYSQVVVAVWLERSVGARPSTCAGVCIRDSFFLFHV